MSPISDFGAEANTRGVDASRMLLRPARPRVFIGSSQEGEAVAKAVQAELDRVVEATVWSQGVFGLSGGTLDELVKACDKFEFAILVLTADDISEKRGVRENSPRDNVLFELGLFMGALGRERTFIVHCRDDKLQLPSDLAGVTTATYARRSDGLLRPAVGAACTSIGDAIRHVQAEAEAEAVTSDTEVRRSSVGTDRLPPEFESILTILSPQGKSQQAEWIADRLKIPAVDAQHLIDKLVGWDLLQDTGSATGYEISKIGRQYVYTWGISRKHVERLSRRTPPGRVQVSVWDGEDGQESTAVLVNASVDGSGIGLTCGQHFKPGSNVFVRVDATDRARDFQARVVQCVKRGDRDVYLGLYITNPIAQNRLASGLNIALWTPWTMAPPGVGP